MTGGTVRAVVLADTHVRPGGRGLPAGAWALLDGADVVVHAGDIMAATFLEELRAVAPVLAVRGNNDVEPALRHLPETLEEELGGVRVGVVHDSGPHAGRAARLRRRFPQAAVVVFGHSHVPWNAPGLDGQLLFNPGSPTQRRAQPRHTAGVLELAGGRVLRHDIVALD